MRPKPLMPTRTVIWTFFLLGYLCQQTCECLRQSDRTVYQSIPIRERYIQSRNTRIPERHALTGIAKDHVH